MLVVGTLSHKNTDRNMADSVGEWHLTGMVFLFIVWASSLSAFEQHNLQSCNTTSHQASWYSCRSELVKCQTFAVIRANSQFDSLSKVSSQLGVDPLAVAAASGLDADAEFVSEGQLLLLPVVCRCNGSFYEASLLRTCVNGDSFLSIAESLQGLTTCLDVREKNPEVSEENLGQNVQLVVPFRCRCPDQTVSNAEFIVSYPMSDGDSISSLAHRFNTSEKDILSVNNGSQVGPFTSVLVPLDHRPVLDPLSKPLVKPHRKKKLSKGARKKRLYMAIIGTVAGLAVLIMILVFGYLRHKRRSKTQTRGSISNKDPETQQLSLSVRTASDKKVSFEGSVQDGPTTDCQNTIGTSTPRKLVLEIFTIEDLERATENFSPGNHIEGSVYHGLFKGKDLAIKRVGAETMKRVDFGLLTDQSYFNHNLIKVLGTSCFGEEDKDGYLVFEYAKNGSLRDWIQNKLAIKNQFIESCYCFLGWKQRIRICLDVAMALKYMHQMNYVHRNLKSRNIFLDEDLRAKVGNFGMPKCDDDSPKYDKETDVYALGIILLEVLTGQTAETLLGAQETREKLVYALGDKETLREMMDSALGESYAVESALEMARIARDCVAEDSGSRPNASEIEERLQRLVRDEEDEEEAEEEDRVLEKESTLVSESSCKPLVKKAVD
ncbi:PREDICTED: protein LYK2 [Tarenaya hassleriana]|uniref:protein LYK2 n=1 Tax=Tarenaya hassleriana TaxID=28532 RepID=UPI00053CA9E1|nr:PREDICTED: protein LYK2 [Tarenaya hassleriana]